MRKIIALLVAMTMVFGVAFALEGLSAGVDFRILDFDAEEISEAMNLRIKAAYEGAFLNDALEIEAEVGFEMLNFDDMMNGIDIEVEGRYFMDLAAATRLGFVLNSKTYMPLDDEKGYIWVFDGVMENKLSSYLKPGLNFRQTFGFGDIYLQVDVPMLIVHDELDPMDEVGLDFTLSIMNERKTKNRGNVTEFPKGFGAEIFLTNILSDPNEDEDFLQGMSITPFFGWNFLYAEVQVNVPLFEDGLDEIGMDIIPKLEMDIQAVNGLSLWLDIPIIGVAADKEAFGDPIIGVGLGLNYRF